MTRKETDAFRQRLPTTVDKDVFLITSGVQALLEDSGQLDPGVALLGLIRKIKDFNEFTEDNDPWKEHDFGCFQFLGEKLFFKFDDYQGHDGFNIVLTVMLAEEY